MSDLVSAISSVGFPIVICLILIFQNNQKMDQAVNAIAENTKQLALLVQELARKEDDDNGHK